MPYRMHSEYLRKLYLDNDLAEGRYKVDGKSVSIGEHPPSHYLRRHGQDHVAPWRSVYKWHALADTDVTFVLTEVGTMRIIRIQNPAIRTAAIGLRRGARPTCIAIPTHGSRRHQFMKGPGGPRGWAGSRNGRGLPVAPPEIGTPGGPYAPKCAAPGTYVHEK